MAEKHDHKSRHIVASVLNDVWAIDPDKLEQICGFLELRANGYTPTQDEIAGIMAANGRGRADEEEDEDPILDGVQHLRLFGTMAPRMNMLMSFSGGTSTQQLEGKLAKALANRDVRTVVLEVDSPGGVVTGTEELRRAVLAMRGRKRVVALARGMAASAAYYVASAAEEFYATPSTTIGSIGVYAIHREMSKAAEDAGIRFTVFCAGRNKAVGNPFEKLDSNATKVLQDRVNEPYEQFLAAVAENRGVTVEQVEERYGQGTVFMAAKAASLGMIDGVRSFGDLMGAERSRAVEPATITVMVHTGSGPIPSISSSPRGAADFQVEKKMNPKIKSALHARGLVEANATDEQCQVVLKSAFRARGETIPDGDDAILAAILGWEQKKTEVQTEWVVTSNVSPSPSPSPTPTPKPKTLDEAAVKLAERNRIADIKSRGEILHVAIEEIQAAVDEGLEPAAAADKWIEDRIAKQKPVQTRIENTEPEIDKTVEAAVAVLGRRCGLQIEPPPHARDMAGMSFLEIGRRCVALSGGRVTHNPEQDALAFLQLGGSDRQVFHSDLYAAENSYNRPGDFPHLLSNLANKILDTGFTMAETTYSQWCGRMSDAADFKPRTIMASGIFDNLDLIMDDEDPKQLKMSEELMQWIAVDRYANKVGLTPVMIANDDLDAFNTQLQSLAYAHEAKLNTLCVAQVGTNPTLPDTVALFSGTTSGHYNIAGTPAAVASASLAEMRTLHRLQPGVGTTKKIKTPARILLAPPSQEEAALQTLAPLVQYEQKMSSADTSINTVRGTLRVVIENDLVDYSAYNWYTLADPAVRRTIVYCFQRGYGAGGQRETWFENGRKTRYVALEGRFAAVAASWRGICVNQWTGS